MQGRGLSFGKRWIIAAVGVVAAAEVIDGIHFNGVVSLFFASLLLGFLNAFIRPVLLMLSLPMLLAVAGTVFLFLKSLLERSMGGLLTVPVVVMAYGMFYLVINSLLLWSIGGLVPGFDVRGFGSSVRGSLVIGGVSLLLGFVLGGRDALVLRRPPPPSRADQGPVIDV
jgi:putative membrane protein